MNDLHNPTPHLNPLPVASRWSALRTALRHRWMDDAAARRLLAGGVGERLRQRVAASEQRHTGQLRLCVEAGLPVSYLWRHFWQRLPLPVVVRQRAVMLFGKLRVWDTERNNGVLIYLLLAGRTIEIVADRGLNAQVSSVAWAAVAERLGSALRAGRFEDGMGQALDEVSALLTAHFPRGTAADGDQAAGPDSARNELPDEPVSL